MTGLPMALGLDIGTSAVKATLLAADGRIDSAVSSPYLTSSPCPGWAEQSPDDWWVGIGEVLDEIAARHDLDDAALVIGLTGQMHTTVLRDERGESLRPAILWSDERAGSQASALAAGQPAWSEVAGQTPIPAFTSAHLEWVREQEPELFRRIARIAVPKDDVRARLGAGWGTEPSDASAMNLLDDSTGEWSVDLLGRLGVGRDQLPPVGESASATGTMSRLPAGTGRASALLGAPVFGGGGDQAAQAVALNVTGPDVLGISVGTSGVAFQALSHGRAGAFRHAVPNTWLALDSTHAAGLALSWWVSLVGAGYDVFSIGSDQPSRAIPVFLPYLQGQRVGHGAPGALVGLRASHQAAEIAEAVIEGVAMELARLVRSVTGGVIPDGPISIGGRAGSLPALRALLAAALDRPITYLARDSAFGAAAIAAQGAGWFDEFSANDASRPVTSDPDQGLTQRLESRAAVYDDLLRRLA